MPRVYAALTTMLGTEEFEEALRTILLAPSSVVSFEESVAHGDVRPQAVTKQGGTETETESRARVVWVGVGFAEASAVAFNGALHLAPYLHVLPADLLAFKPLLAKLGVRERFEADDYVTLLRRLRRDAGTDQPLSERRLDVALWVLGSVADARRASRAGKHSDDDALDQ